jgi:hypothetical protein
MKENSQIHYGIFDISKLEAPIKMFYAKMPQKEMLMDPSLLFRGGMISR